MILSSRGMNYWHTCYGWISKIICWVKEGWHKRGHSLGFLWSSRKAKIIQDRFFFKTVVASRRRWEGGVRTNQEGTWGTFCDDGHVLYLEKRVIAEAVCALVRALNGTLKICASQCINFTSKERTINKYWTQSTDTPTEVFRSKHTDACNLL